MTSRYPVAFWISSAILAVVLTIGSDSTQLASTKGDPAPEFPDLSAASSPAHP